MKKIIQKGIYIIFGLSLLLPHIGVIAQEKANIDEYKSNLNPEGLRNATLGNCFDIYNLGKVDVNVGLDQNTYEPGDVIYIKGELKNNNTYPLPDLKVRAKIVKIEQEEDKRIIQTVDEIVLKDNININSLGSYIVEYKYIMPFQAAKGEYEILLSVIQNDQINIAGLPFTEEMPASYASFKIGGNNIEDISVKQNEIKLNNEILDSLSINPIYEKIEPVNISVPIQNNTNEDKEVEIQYEVYSWSDDLGKVEKELKEQKTIVKKGSNIANYTIKEPNKAIYYVKIKIKDTKTPLATKWGNIVNIRFRNSRINEPRITALTFNTSPYAPDKELKLLTCIYNINDAKVDIILENIVKDEKDKIIASSEYKGVLTGQIDGIYTKLPNNKYNKLTVTSTIKDANGSIINTIESVYDCKDLDPSQCTNEQNNNRNNIIILAVLSIIILIFTILMFIFRKYKKTN